MSMHILFHILITKKTIISICTLLIIEVNITNIERWISLFKETRVGNETAKMKITLAYIYYEKLDIINSLDFYLTLIYHYNIGRNIEKVKLYMGHSDGYNLPPSHQTTHITRDMAFV